MSLGAATCLPDDEREVVIEFAADDFIADRGYKLGFLASEKTKVCIGESSGFFEESKVMDEDFWKVIMTDFKHINRALGLSSVIAIHRDGNLAHTVGFGADVHGETP